MNRVVLKRVEKYFDSLKYTLVIYYHKDLEINEIHNRVIRREPLLSDMEKDDCERNEALTITHDEGQAFLICNQNTPIGTLQHEANHITMAAFTFVGARHTEETDELFAYSSQHIFEFIVSTFLNKLGVPPKKLLNL